jgi:hypothetical protein
MIDPDKPFDIEISTDLAELQRDKALVFYQQLNRRVDEIYQEFGIDPNTPIKSIPPEARKKVEEYLFSLKK